MVYQQGRCAAGISSLQAATIVEAQVRQEFVITLADEIISPLTALKVSRELRAGLGVVGSLLMPIDSKAIAKPNTRAGQTRSQGVCRRAHRLFQEDSQV
jgi:hypothetical protein